MVPVFEGLGPLIFRMVPAFEGLGPLIFRVVPAFVGLGPLIFRVVPAFEGLGPMVFVCLQRLKVGRQVKMQFSFNICVMVCVLVILKSLIAT